MDVNVEKTQKQSIGIKQSLMAVEKKKQGKTQKSSESDARCHLFGSENQPRANMRWRKCHTFKPILKIQTHFNPWAEKSKTENSNDVGVWHASFWKGLFYDIYEKSNVKRSVMLKHPWSRLINPESVVNPTHLNTARKVCLCLTRFNVLPWDQKRV